MSECNNVDFEALCKLPIWDDAIESENEYILPVPNGVVTPKHLTKGYSAANLLLYGSVWTKYTGAGHAGPSKHALDFLVPDGTPVLATQDGTVRTVVEHNTEHGTTPDMLTKANMVIIEHANHEITLYAHLALHSVLQSGLKVGDSVELGQPIATVGKSGWMEPWQDHVHFEVRGPDPRPQNPTGQSSRQPKFTIQPLVFDQADL